MPNTSNADRIIPPPCPLAAAARANAQDTMSKTDALVVLYMKEGDQWQEVGRTEQVNDNLNPEFATPFLIQYHFERNQKLKFVVVDIDNATIDISDDDLVGEFRTRHVFGITEGGRTRWHDLFGWFVFGRGGKKGGDHVA